MKKYLNVGADLFKNKNLYVHDYALINDKISEKLNLDLSELTNIYKHIPLCLNGEEHKKSRKKITNLIVSNKYIRKNMDSLIKSEIKNICTPGEKDILKEFIIPLRNELLFSMLYLKDVYIPKDLPLIFNPFLGITKRQNINNEIKITREEIRLKFPDYDETYISYCISIMALAGDTLTGFIGQGLEAIFSNKNYDLDYQKTFDIPPYPIIPNIYRKAVCPFKSNNREIKNGEEFKFNYDNIDMTNMKNRMLIFGSGIHTCSGRSISIMIWELIIKELKKYDININILEYSLSSDKTIMYPNVFKIKVC